MAKGWDPVQQQAAQTAESRERAQQTYLPELKVNQKNPGPYQVRFLEQGQEVSAYPVHEYKVPNTNVQGGVLHKRFTCLSEVGQPCPGCTAGLKRKVRGVFNIVQRNRPVLRKGQDGKAIKDPMGNWIVDGYQDEVVVANVGGPTSEMLRKADGQYHGLMSRDFVIGFSGDTFQAYNMTPALDETGSSNPSPLSQNDQALAAKKHDLDAYMKPPSHEEATKIVQQYGNNSGATNMGAVGGQPTMPGAPMGSPPTGNAMQAQPANGFLAGAQIPAQPGGAFGAAQVAVPQVVPAPAPVPQVPQPAAAPVQPQVQGVPAQPQMQAPPAPPAQAFPPPQPGEQAYQQPVQTAPPAA